MTLRFPFRWRQPGLRSDPSKDLQLHADLHVWITLHSPFRSRQPGLRTDSSKDLQIHADMHVWITLRSPFRSRQPDLRSDPSKDVQLHADLHMRILREDFPRETKLAGPWAHAHGRETLPVWLLPEMFCTQLQSTSAWERCAQCLQQQGAMEQNGLADEHGGGRNWKPAVGNGFGSLRTDVGGWFESVYEELESARSWKSRLYVTKETQKRASVCQIRANGTDVTPESRRFC